MAKFFKTTVDKWRDRKRDEDAVLRDITSKLSVEERHVLERIIRRRIRARPFRFKFKELQIEGRSKRFRTLINVRSPEVHAQSYRPNPDRIVLGTLGEMELYCYPRIWPERVFLGIYPKNVMLGEMEARALFSIAMKAHWFFRSSKFLGKYVEKKKQNLFNRKSFRGFKGEEIEFKDFKSLRKNNFPKFNYMYSSKDQIDDEIAGKKPGEIVEREYWRSRGLDR